MDAMYDTVARALAAGERDDEDDAATRPLRACTSFAKACVLEAALRAVAADAVVVLDVACGRGQDLPKLFHGLRHVGKTLHTLAGLDVSGDALAYADAVARKFFPAAGGPAVVLWPADAGGATWGGPPLPPAHVAVCHLALHYWCDSPSRLGAFFANLVARLDADGVVLLSFPDGRWVVRHGREAAARAPPDTDPVAFAVGPATVVVPRSSLRLATPSPYGLGYGFTLGRRRVVASTEYLVHEGSVLRAARRAGLAHVAFSWRLDEGVAALGAHPWFGGTVAGLMRVGAEVRGPPPAAADLYRFVGLARTPEAAARLAGGLKPPGPPAALHVRPPA